MRKACRLAGLFAGLSVAWSCLQAADTAPSHASQSQTAQLKSLTLQQLGNIEVTTVSKQPEEVWHTPAAVFVLTHDDIRRSGATTIPDLLRLVPGVQVAQEQSDQWAVGIRGFDGQFSRGLLVLIDGRSVYTPLFEGVYWDVQDLPLDDIDRIEVIRGPGGSVWGPNAVNGVINIITRSAADTQGTMVDADGGGPVEHFAGSIRAGFSPTPNLQMRVFAKGFDRGPEFNPGHDPYDHWRQERGGFRADWSPTQNDKLTATGMIYGGRTGDQNAIGQFTPPAQLIVDGEQLVSGGDVMLRWDRQLGGGSDLYLQGYIDRTNRATSQFTETRDTVDLDFIDHVANLPRQDVILGAGLRESPSNIVQTQTTVNFLPHAQNDYLYSLFAQDAIVLMPDRLTFTLGSKIEDNNFSGWGAEPSARMLWNPRSHTTLWGAVSRALRTPGRVDSDLTLIGNYLASPPIFVSVNGNPNFKPEVLIGWEAGYRQLLHPTFYVDVAAFHNQYDDVESYGGPIPLITTPTQPYPYTSINVEFANGLRGVTDGLEIAPDWKPVSWWELRGSYSHLHMALHSKPGYSQASYAAGDEGSAPDHQASLQAVFTLPRAFVIVPDYRYMSALPADSVKACQTADARIAWSFAKHYGISVNGRNLLQPYHEEFAGDNGNPVGIRRSLYAGLEWSR
ncbi:MAG TPA: TonB-dependent receptor [Acidobacteriaceae bacterium]|nr:TonB-dependent receptor [Acidobacteriaceae bacterium]